MDEDAIEQMTEIVEELVPILSLVTIVLITLFVLIALVLIVIFSIRYRHKERMELIKQGINPLAISHLFPGRKALFWGLLLLGLGLAGITAIFSNPGSIGGFIVLLLFYTTFFIGLTMLIYWRITKRQREKTRSVPALHCPTVPDR